MKPSKQKTLRLHLNESSAHAGLSSTYPDQAPLVAALAKNFGVPEDCVLLVAGAAHGLEVAIRSHDGTVVTPDPCFPLSPKFAIDYARQLVRVPFVPGQAFPIDEVLTACRETKTQVIVSTVENPTGVVLTSACVERLKSEPDIEVVIDEVYSRFLGSPSMYAKAAAKTKGMVVVTSFSKWGLPGIRVGVVIARPERIAEMRHFVSAFCVGGPSILMALRALAKPASIEAGIKSQIRARDALVDGLEKRGIPYVASPANWVLVDVGDEQLKVAAFFEKHHVLIQVPAHPSLGHYIRVSTPSQAAMKSFFQIFDSFKTDK